MRCILLHNTGKSTLSHTVQIYRSQRLQRCLLAIILIKRYTMRHRGWYCLDMKSFADQYGIAINDPTLLQRYRMEMNWQREDASRLNAAERRGIDKNRRETAKRMKDDGMDYALIAKYTCLTTGQITEL